MARRAQNDPIRKPAAYHRNFIAVASQISRGFLYLTERPVEQAHRQRRPAEKRRHQVFMMKLDDASATRSLPLTTIAKPMNLFAACGDPKAERGSRIER
jgi:hypothetical protein